MHTTVIIPAVMNAILSAKISIKQYATLVTKQPKIPNGDLYG